MNQQDPEDRDKNIDNDDFWALYFLIFLEK